LGPKSPANVLKVTFKQPTYSNPRQSTQQCNDALTCSAAAESHHKSGHGRPSHPAQRSTRNTKHDCNAAIIHPTTDPNTRQGGPTAPASTQRGGVDLRSITPYDSPKTRPATAAAISTHPRSAYQKPRPPIQSKLKIILKLSCLRALTCAANMGDW
jgi:hypothetical protein